MDVVPFVDCNRTKTQISGHTHTHTHTHTHKLESDDFWLDFFKNTNENAAMQIEPLPTTVGGHGRDVGVEDNEWADFF